MLKTRKGLWIAAQAIVAAIVIYIFFLLPQKSKRYQATDYAMSTIVQFQLYGQDAENTKKACMKEIRRLENEVMSWRLSDSEIAQLNAASKEMTISEELYNWLLQIEQIEQDSQGALDITILPVAQLWNIEGDSPTVPNREEIEEKRLQVGYNKITLLGDNKVALEPDVKIDIGAIGKGIACDAMAELMKEVKQMAGTISVGGSIMIKGSKPNGESWNLGVQDPRGASGEVLGVYSTNEECFMSTSGDYEKYFEQDGIRYHHILDPATGYPADSGLISVTIIADNGLVSDALSTACFILGKEEGKKLADQYNAQVIFVDKQKNVYVSDEIKTQFQLKANGYQIKEW